MSTAIACAHVADGVAHAAADQPLAMRLVALFRQIGAVLERFRPDEAAVEETFVNKNPSSTLKLGVARGVVLLAPAERGLPVAEYSANLIKKSVVGAGHAEKAQVQMMVRRSCCPAATIGTADAADALAVAICHAHHAQTAPAPGTPPGDRQARRDRRPDRRGRRGRRRGRRRLSRLLLDPDARPRCRGPGRRCAC